MAWNKSFPTYTLEMEEFEACIVAGDHIARRSVQLEFSKLGVAVSIREWFAPSAPPAFYQERETPESRRYVRIDDLVDVSWDLHLHVMVLCDGEARGRHEELLVQSVYWSLCVKDVLGWGQLAKYLPETRAWADKVLQQFAVAGHAGDMPHGEKHDEQ